MRAGSRARTAFRWDMDPGGCQFRSHYKQIKIRVGRREKKSGCCCWPWWKEKMLLLSRRLFHRSAVQKKKKKELLTIQSSASSHNGARDTEVHVVLEKRMAEPTGSCIRSNPILEHVRFLAARTRGGGGGGGLGLLLAVLVAELYFNSADGGVRPPAGPASQ